MSLTSATARLAIALSLTAVAVLLINAHATSPPTTNDASHADTDPPSIVLWPEGAPDAVGDSKADRPSMTIYTAPIATGRDDAKSAARRPAILVCPGGGYRHLALGHEGRDVAEWLNSIGIHAFVLEYRIAPRYHYPAPLLDVKRAMRTIRARAETLGVDSKHIGVLGFSAGGHLASSLATHFDAGDAKAADPIEHESCRPDFQVLIYPVISMTAPFAHVGSRNAFCGSSDATELATKFSNETRVTERTPPAFLVHTTTDHAVPAENSIAYYRALKSKGVAVELHLFERGPHGFGLAPSDARLSAWTGLCRAWIEATVH